jgi:hypothetical protein
LYQIFQKEIPVGQAEIKEKGLYHFINCQCCPHGDGIYRIILLDDSLKIDLGICVPHGKQQVLKKHIPQKQFKLSNPHFVLVEHRVKRKMTVALKSGIEFASIIFSIVVSFLTSIISTTIPLIC